MNDDKLLRLADFLEQLPPDRFDFSTWARDKQGSPVLKLEEGDCGTVACAGGWATTLWPDDLVLFEGMPCIRSSVYEMQESEHDDYPVVSGSDALAQFFDISLYDAQRLFLPRISKRWQKGLPSKASAAEVAAHIRQFVQEKQDAAASQE